MKTEIEKQYRQCTHCILDTIDDPHITFDSNGVCNYCHQYYVDEKQYVFKGEEGEEKLQEIVEKIKQAGKNKKYDSIMGVSGGVDSTYLALKAKEFGLRPLLVHMDNGWNSELAVKNIENIVTHLGFDLYTLVIDWSEFRDIQRAYFKANVVDIEAITDHAIIATMYKLAEKYGIKYILSGTNIPTEGILPHHWVFYKLDSINIKAIHKAYGTVSLKTFPFVTPFQRKRYDSRFGIVSVSLLNCLPYVKEKVKQEIIQKLQWKDYGGKHYESIFTRFYQGYILPKKFHIDKRKAHLSTLICSGQMTREQALEEMKKPVYDENVLWQDREFVLKKLGLSDEEFEQYLAAPRREHTEFGYDKKSVFEQYKYLKVFQPLLQLLRRIRNRK